MRHLPAGGNPYAMGGAGMSQKESLSSTQERKVPLGSLLKGTGWEPGKDGLEEPRNMLSPAGHSSYV